MPDTVPLKEEQLASALVALGVRFVASPDGQAASLHRQPARLLAGLAASREARLRLALIPLLLQHPEFSSQAGEACSRLSEKQALKGALTLRCYYTAAAIFQRAQRTRLLGVMGKFAELPDLFSGELGLALSGDCDADLTKLGAVQACLSGMDINWPGTYRHAMDVFWGIRYPI